MLQTILYVFLMWMAVGLAIAQMAIDRRVRQGNIMPITPAAVFILALIWPVTAYALYNQR